MTIYLFYIGMIFGLPLAYWVILEWQKPYFELENNRNRKMVKSAPEYLCLLISEAALMRLLYVHYKGSISNLTIALLYVVLIVMTVLCMTDLWEKIVPNKILLLLLSLGFLIIGMFFVQNSEAVIQILPSSILGIIFCFLTFGIGYMVSKGSLGSGDVKLSFLLGLFLTGEYVVGTVFYGCVAGSIYSIVQLCRKKLSRNDELPFVPFLYLGLIITYFVGV